MLMSNHCHRRCLHSLRLWAGSVRMCLCNSFHRNRIQILNNSVGVSLFRAVPPALRSPLFDLDLSAMDTQLAGSLQAPGGAGALASRLWRQNVLVSGHCVGERSLLLPAGHISLHICRAEVHQALTVQYQVASGFRLWICRIAGGCIEVSPPPHLLDTFVLSIAPKKASESQGPWLDTSRYICSKCNP